jgi:hypothetical protein
LLEGVIRSEEIHGMPKQILYYSGNNTESTRTILNFNVHTNLGDITRGSQCEVEKKSVAESADSTPGASILMSNFHFFYMLTLKLYCHRRKIEDLGGTSIYCIDF